MKAHKSALPAKDSKTQDTQNMTQGEYLRSVREQKGLTLETVHEVTKIPMDALRAIEEGYTVRTLSSFYHKGFLKIYSKYLDVDIAEVIDGYKEEQLPQYVPKSVEEFDWEQWVAKIFTRQRKQQIVIVAGIALVLFVLFQLITFIVHRPKKEHSSRSVIMQPKALKPVKSVGKSKTKVSKVKAPVVVTAIPTSSKPAPVQVAMKNVTLTVRAKKSSWLQVKADGVVVFQSTLNYGSVETWLANEKIEITGRNINQLEFELNGKMIGSLGRADRKAKGLVVTKDGLTVTK